MLQSRRTLIAVTVLLVLLAVGAGLASRPAPEHLRPPETAQRDAGAATTTVADQTLKIGAAREQSVRARVGQQLRLTVEGADSADVVVLDGLDQQAQTSPDLPAVFDLLPTRAGTYPIELQSSGERVGALRVKG